MRTHTMLHTDLLCSHIDFFLS